MAARRGALRFVARRLGLTLLTLWSLASLVFLMIKAIPGDEAQVAAGPDASLAQVEAVRVRLGLDAPLVVQYLRFIWRLLHGDLGASITTFQPVAADLARVLPSTIELVLIAMPINLAVSIPVATLAAAQRGGLFDGLSRIAAVLAGGLPVFWLALILQHLLGSVWRVLPISGQHSFGFSAPARTGLPTVDALLARDLPTFADAVTHVILPASVLAVLFITQIFRALRTSILGILQGEFIVTVRAKGASSARVLIRHALPNALNPVLLLAGTQLGVMIGMAVLVETVFARPGVGSYLANAVAQKDTYAVLGAVLFVGVVVSLVNLVVDILQLMLDPRIRAAQTEESVA
jgi:peptide/nickel transport system permease protein